MCVSTDIVGKKGKMAQNNRRQVGRNLRLALTSAEEQGRLVAGLTPSVKLLESCPDDAVVCIMAPAKDAAAHIRTVLLEAVCYENFVPVLQVDSAEKLAEYCGLSDKKSTAQCDCVIITRDNNLEVTKDNLFPMSPPEKSLTEFYENTLEQFPRPIIELPI